MSEGQIVSIISMLGALILFGSSYRSYRVGGMSTLVMALIWIGIFLLVVMVVTAFEWARGVSPLAS